MSLPDQSLKASSRSWPVCRSNVSSSASITAGSMLQIIPGRCLPPQPQISDWIVLGWPVDFCFRTWTVLPLAFLVPQAHPQLVSVVGPQQQPDAAFAIVATQQSETLDLKSDDSGSQVSTPGNNDCPIRHSRTIPLTTKVCREDGWISGATGPAFIV